MIVEENLAPKEVFFTYAGDGRFSEVVVFMLLSLYLIKSLL